MCCKKNIIVFIILLEIVINLRLFVKCGRVKRVIGAMDVPYGTQPRVASLRNSSSLRHLCGATLLSPQFALTAAHCVQYNENQYILQLNNLCISEYGTSPRAKVLQIIGHPYYDPISRAHDVAVLRIALHHDDTAWLNETLLPTSSFGLSGECTLYGYGHTDVNSMDSSERLLAGRVRVVSLDTCTKALGPVAPRYGDGLMCAVGDGVDACQGDSGSPLICSGGTIEGLSSYGMSCGVPGLPGVYLSVAAHLPWIRAIIQDQK